MLAIVKVLGSPTDEDKEFITDKEALAYLENFKDHPPVEFGDFIKNPPEAIDLLKRML